MSRKSIHKRAHDFQTDLSPEDRSLFKAAWEIARENHGDTFLFYLPGMIRYGNIRGRYPAISITGDQCDLQCDHCKGQLLQKMLKANGPDQLLKRCIRLARNGAHGVLLTGGSNPQGRLPWETYLTAIKRIKEQTDLFLSVHTGFPDDRSCNQLKEAGIRQGLVDVMGNDETAKSVYHLKDLKPVLDALGAIKRSGLELVPHVVAGLAHGKIDAEYNALEIIRHHQPAALVIVVLTPMKGTPMEGAKPPSPLDVGRLVARARLLMPEVPISLGCERPRNREGLLMELLAIRAGANRMAVWSDQAIDEARRLGLTPRFQATCCSLDYCEEFRCAASGSADKMWTT
ncbi:MAG: hypothetical protein KKG10_10280 [Proteobacteria bacterium]|nr:hypothetical protein [Pseudomonadota bacterium]